MVGTYHSPRRADAAAATRTAILDNARAMFLDRGYTDVTVNDIAKAARVAVQTVYASTGGKAAILSALLQPAVDDPGAEETLTAVASINDPRQVINATAAGTRRVHERHWDTIYGLLRHAPGESEAQQVIKTTTERYLDALRTVAERLMALDALKPECDLAQTLDLLWFFLGQPAWFTLVGQRSWTFDQAEEWLAHSAQRALLKRRHMSEHDVVRRDGAIRP
jgi:AcrR family transcriptional regulator